MAGTRRATIYDVALLSGVATSTVSRALSKPGRVSVATRERVLAAATRVGYVPHGPGRSLSSGQTNAVALLVADITNPFYFDLIRGTQRQLTTAGYTQLLVDTEESAEVEAHHLALVRSSVDGVILAASRLSDDQLVAVSAQMAVVTINRSAPDVPTVIIDTPSGVAQAVEHLVSLGHRRIAYLGGPVRSFADTTRWGALGAAADRLGIDVVRLGPFPPTLGAGAGAADAMLNSGATACVAFNDLIAIGMLQRFEARGVLVPGDISVVGCDDIFGSSFCHPPLTTITAPIERAGLVAVDMLLGLLRGILGPPRRYEMLATHLTVRASTGQSPSSRSSVRLTGAARI